jgi:hypothetical protein
MPDTVGGGVVDEDVVDGDFVDGDVVGGDVVGGDVRPLIMPPPTAYRQFPAATFHKNLTRGQMMICSSATRPAKSICYPFLGGALLLLLPIPGAVGNTDAAAEVFAALSAFGLRFSLLLRCSLPITIVLEYL